MRQAPGRTGQSEPRADGDVGQLRPPWDTSGEGDAAPPGNDPQSVPESPTPSLPQALDRPREPAGPGWPPSESADSANASAPPPTDGHEPSPRGQQPPPSPGPRPHTPVPPEERNQFISRRRCGMCCRPTRPRHHRRHGDKLPSAGTTSGPAAKQRPATGSAAARVARCGPERPQPAPDPQPGSGPRAPSWDWGSPSGSGTGGAELRAEQISASN